MSATVIRSGLRDRMLQYSAIFSTQCYCHTLAYVLRTIELYFQCQIIVLLPLHVRYVTIATTHVCKRDDISYNYDDFLKIITVQRIVLHE